MEEFIKQGLVEAFADPIGVRILLFFRKVTVAFRFSEQSVTEGKRTTRPNWVPATNLCRSNLSMSLYAVVPSTRL